MSSIYEALKRVQHEDAPALPMTGRQKTWSNPRNWTIIIVSVTISSLVTMGVYSYLSTPPSNKNIQSKVSTNNSQTPLKPEAMQKTRANAAQVNPPVEAAPQDPVADAPDKSRDEYIETANICFEKGELDKAISIYKEALGVYKNDAGLINNLGAVLLAKSDYENAIKYFRIAIQCSKDDVEPVYNLACAYAKKGDNALALKELKKAIKMNGQDVRKWAKDDPDLKSLKGTWD
jgi:tetratricopeptide (TPR) repeat protein